MAKGLADISINVIPTEARILRNGIANLVSAYGHAQDIKFDKALLNMELLSFGIGWFGMVSITSPHMHLWPLHSPQGYQIIPGRA